MKTICMLGDGAWGTAIAHLLATNGHRVKLWCHNPTVADTIAQTQCNERYLPGVQLPVLIEPHADLQAALADVDWVFEAIPVQFMREILHQAKPYVDTSVPWVVLSKGIEQKSYMLPTDLVRDVLGDVPVSLLAGPSFAKEVVTKKITAVTVASSECEVVTALQDLVATDYFRPYGSTDVVGVQIGAAIKNVITLGVGMLDGAGYSDNAQAFIVTRGLHEMVQLAIAMGGKQKTMYGLSGVGDVVLTCGGALSKNLTVGKRLGAGDSLETILAETGFVPEGINTIESVQQLAQKHAVALPICFGVYSVIHGKKTLDAMVRELMGNPLEWECR